MANAYPQSVSASSSPEVQMNENATVSVPIALFGKNPVTTTGLTLGIYGEYMYVDGVLTLIADTTLLLTASQTNYVEATRAGVVSANTTAFTAGRIPIATAVTSASAITTYTDMRVAYRPPGVHGRLSKSASAGGTVTLSAEEARNEWLNFTGVLPSATSIVVPNGPQIWVVTNSTAGSPIQTLTVKTSAGTGVTVGEGKSRWVGADGTNVVALSDEV